jgi:hypothetical protein
LCQYHVVSLCTIIWSQVLKYLYSFSLRIALAVQDLLYFYMNFRIFFYFCEECHWNLMRTSLNPYIACGGMPIITFILLIHKHRRSLHLLVSSMSFCLVFSLYLCIFCCCEWDCFQQVHFWCMVYIKATFFFVWFYNLFLCWKHISDLNLLVESLGSFKCRVIWHAYKWR